MLGEGSEHESAFHLKKFFPRCRCKPSEWLYRVNDEVSQLHSLLEDSESSPLDEQLHIDAYIPTLRAPTVEELVEQAVQSQVQKWKERLKLPDGKKSSRRSPCRLPALAPDPNEHPWSERHIIKRLRVETELESFKLTHDMDEFRFKRLFVAHNFCKDPHRTATRCCEIAAKREAAKVTDSSSQPEPPPNAPTPPEPSPPQQPALSARLPTSGLPTTPAPVQPPPRPQQPKVPTRPSPSLPSPSSVPALSPLLLPARAPSTARPNYPPTILGKATAAVAAVVVSPRRQNPKGPTLSRMNIDALTAGPRMLPMIVSPMPLRGQTPLRGRPPTPNGVATWPSNIPPLIWPFPQSVEVAVNYRKRLLRKQGMFPEPFNLVLGPPNGVPPGNPAASNPFVLLPASPFTQLLPYHAPAAPLTDQKIGFSPSILPSTPAVAAAASATPTVVPADAISQTPGVLTSTRDNRGGKRASPPSIPAATSQTGRLTPASLGGGATFSTGVRASPPAPPTPTSRTTSTAMRAVFTAGNPEVSVVSTASQKEKDHTAPDTPSSSSPGGGVLSPSPSPILELTRSPSLQPVNPDEVIVTVSFYHPVRGLKVAEYDILGSQTLLNLKDTFLCAEDISFCAQKYTWSCFFIAGCFYVDDRVVDKVDFAPRLIEYLREKIPGRVQSGDCRFLMGATQVKEIELPFNERAAYLHRGDCEHRLTFTSMRKFDQELDCPYVGGYPVRTFEPSCKVTLCQTCVNTVASKTVFNSTLLPQNPMVFCQKCFDRFFRDEQGNLISDEDFTHFEYRDVI